jgi:hypothetical protein
MVRGYKMVFNGYPSAVLGEDRFGRRTVVRKRE